MTILPAVALALAVSSQGLYVWDAAVSMADGRGEDLTEQRALVEFCRAPGVDVRRLYFLVDFERSATASLDRLLSDAAGAGIEVYALHPGSLQDTWVRPFPANRACDHAAVLSWVDRVLQHNQLGDAPERRFRGIQLDIEPHLARSRSGTVWRERGAGLQSKRNARLAAQFLELLDRVRERMRAVDPTLQLAVTLPTWFDRHADGESYRLRYDGEQKLLAFHVMDRVDFVTLMDYVEDASSSSVRRAVDNVKDELAYGPAEVLFETSKLGGRWPRRAVTLYGRGEKAYLQLCRGIEQEFGESENWVGCAAHHYLSAYGSGKRGWPRHR